ncbi:MAG: hypothetical protein IJF07_00555 [Lachnospiraceae bacterium]|nr:hypothetical protein [Lachnospiraceae bacterium]
MKEKLIGWLKKDSRYILLTKAFLIAGLPIVGCLLYCAMQGRSISEVYLPGSEWNDELFYFKQVESIVKYGYPQGYFGFNESHALKLSFAAWSPVLVFPWVIWGLLFGWNLMTPIVCNIVILTVTFFCFVWLVKPTWKQLGIFTLLFFLYTPFVRYMLSGMPEVICFGMLMLFYSIVISYLRKETTAKLVWLFVLSALMMLMRPYMLLFLALPMVFWVKRSKWKGFIGSVVVLAVVGGIYGAIKHYLGAEYFAPLFFTDWITAFFERGLFGGIRYFFGKLYWNGLDFISHVRRGIQAGLASGAFFSGYLVMMGILLYQSLVDFRTWRKKKEDKENTNRLIVEAHLGISFVGMLFALLLMYKLTEGSKHLLTFMAAGILVISIMKTRFFKKAVLMGAVFAYFYSYMAIDPYDYQVPFVEEGRMVQVESWGEIFDRELMLKTENVPNYDNAIIWTFSDTTPDGLENLKWQFLYELPVGFGISCCMSDYVIENFDTLQNRYIATVSDGEIDALCKEAGFRELGRDEDMVVYERY